MYDQFHLYLSSFEPGIVYVPVVVLKYLVFSWNFDIVFCSGDSEIGSTCKCMCNHFTHGFILGTWICAMRRNRQSRKQKHDLDLHQAQTQMLQFTRSLHTPGRRFGKLHHAIFFYGYEGTLILS
jgi:hypothetical protein